MFKILLSLVVIALTVAVPGGGAQAAQQQPAAQSQLCDAALALDWSQLQTQAFTVLTTAETEWIGERLASNRRGAALDREMRRFETLFGATLPTPLTIRVYPNTRTFDCLNTSSDAIHPAALHGHAGGREIALIGENIRLNIAAWAQNDLNAIRFELGYLFAQQLAAGAAPPGLPVAIGRYVQDPQRTLGRLDLSSLDWQQPANTWRELWEDPAAASDLGRQIEGGSTIAFLVDNYGWEPLTRFLRALPSARSFGLALEQVYALEPAALEIEWQRYYPRYFAGGWRDHFIYNFNLAPFEALIRQEQYRQADAELQAAIAFIRQMDDPEKLLQAQILQFKAHAGQEGEYLWGQSQQAFQAGNFEGSLALLNQAEQKYAAAGTRIYHLDEFAGLRRQVTMVLVEHLELERLDAGIAREWNTFALARRLVVLAGRLNALGDRHGHARVIALAQALDARQQRQALALAAALMLIVLALLALRIGMLRRIPPPEAQL